MENRPLKPRSNHEEMLMRRRDRESQYAETWGNTVKYYDRFDKVNTKFDEWTSPRYYESNNEMMATKKRERDKLELLEKRRERLTKLLAEDERTYDIELMVKNRDQFSSRRGRTEDIPTELLKSVNDGLKLEEETRRRLKAEESLYKHWQTSNPVLRECRRQKNTKDIKMSWLDQQIEKRMAKEKEEEQVKKLFKEKDLYIKEQKAKEEELAKEMSDKKRELSDFLEKQMEEIKQRELDAKQLRQAETESLAKRVEVLRLEEKWIEEEKIRDKREIALYNMKEHRRRLELKSKTIEEELEEERNFIEEIKKAELLEKIADENKKQQLKDSMDEFARLIGELKDLEQKRKPHLLFTFESEAKDVFDQFNGQWSREKEMRAALIKDVLDEIKAQMDANVEKNKERQREVIREKEAMLENVARYQEDMKRLKDEEELKKRDFKKDLDQQIKENRLRRRRLDTLEKRKVDDQLETMRNEEERLKREIAKIHRGKDCPTYGRRRFFY